MSSPRVLKFWVLGLQRPQLAMESMPSRSSSDVHETVSMERLPCEPPAAENVIARQPASTAKDQTKQAMPWWRRALKVVLVLGWLGQVGCALLFERQCSRKHAA